MTKTHLYILLVIVALLAAGTTTYLFFTDPYAKQNGELRQRAEKLFPENPKLPPLTGGQEIKPDFN